MWHVLRARAVAAGVIGRPGAPTRLLDCDLQTVLGFAESLIFDSGEDNAKALDRLYRTESKPEPVDRASAIEDFMRRVGR